MSASAFPGRRDDWNRAGMMAIAETETRKLEGPVSETGGTANLTTVIRRRTATDSHNDGHGWTRMNTDFTWINRVIQRDTMTSSGLAHVCTQNRGLRRRWRAARGVSGVGEHAVTERSAARSRAASRRHRRNRI